MNQKQEEMPALFLHVGLHKTGTTFLQREVFPKLQSVRFLRSPEISCLLTRLVAEEDSSFDPALYRRFFDPLIESSPSLISDEGLCGSPYRLYVNQARTANRLAQIFPHAQIMVGIRRQDTMLRSLYLHLINSGDNISLEEFLGYEQGEFRNRYQYFLRGRYPNLSMFQYSHIGGMYAELFSDRVQFLVYEHLCQDIADYVRSVCHMVGEPKVPHFRSVVHNRSYGFYQLQIARFLNRFFYSDMNPHGLIPGFWLPGLKLHRFNRVLIHDWVCRWFDLWPKNNAIMPETLGDSILEYYSQSNAAFEQRWQLGLNQWGYIVGNGEVSAGEHTLAKQLR